MNFIFIENRVKIKHWYTETLVQKQGPLTSKGHISMNICSISKISTNIFTFWHSQTVQSGQRLISVLYMENLTSEVGLVPSVYFPIVWVSCKISKNSLKIASIWEIPKRELVLMFLCISWDLKQHQNMRYKCHTSHFDSWSHFE